MKSLDADAIEIWRVFCLKCKHEADDSENSPCQTCEVKPSNFEKVE